MTTKLINGDCIEEMKKLEDNSIDLLFTDLPYGQTSCKWDCKIDLANFWKEINRICKINCPMFFCCTTKFGSCLINSNPKNFRYDYVWSKSRKSGFLNSGKMPLRSHEMVYVFYRKQPVYNVKQYHKHKFLKEEKPYCKVPTIYNDVKHEENRKISGYEPALPDSVIKDMPDMTTTCWGKNKKKDYGKFYLKQGLTTCYDPPLPNTIITESKSQISSEKKAGINNLYGDMKGGTIGNIHGTNYEPPLPDSVITETRNDDGCESMYGNEKGKKDRYIVNGKLRDSEPRYEPPLPNSLIKQEVKEKIYNFVLRDNFGCDTNLYEPPMPDSILTFKNQGKLHQTQKPTELIDFFIKYYSNPGDTILDPTCGSGSTGVSCKNLARNFIGMELDEKIFKVAEERINKKY